MDGKKSRYRQLLILLVTLKHSKHVTKLTSEAHANDSTRQDQDKQPSLGIRSRLFQAYEDRLFDFILVAVAFAGQAVLCESALGLVQPLRVAGIVR